MIIFFHELKRNKISLIIWTAVLSFMLGVCILIFPELEKQMGAMNDLFEGMGEFGAAFQIESFLSYFAIECSEVLGIGGAIFASITAINILSKEQKDRTAEFLLSLPIQRKRVVGEKLAFVYTQIFIHNLIVCLINTACIFVIGQKADILPVLLIFAAYFILEIEIASISFFLSALLKGNGIGLGLGVPLLFYFLYIIANITEKTKFLSYLTPFSYTNAQEIANTNQLEIKYILIGMAVSLICILLAFRKYQKKDIT